MLKSVKNYILKASALVGFIATLVYLAPSKKNLDLEPQAKESQNKQANQSSRIKNERDIASVSTPDKKDITRRKREITFLF